MIVAHCNRGLFENLRQKFYIRLIVLLTSIRVSEQCSVSLYLLLGRKFLRVETFHPKTIKVQVENRFLLKQRIGPYSYFKIPRQDNVEDKNKREKYLELF